MLWLCPGNLVRVPEGPLSLGQSALICLHITRTVTLSRKCWNGWDHPFRLFALMTMPLAGEAKRLRKLFFLFCQVCVLLFFIMSLDNLLVHRMMHLSINAYAYRGINSCTYVCMLHLYKEQQMHWWLCFFLSLYLWHSGLSIETSKPFQIMFTRLA